MSLNAGMNATIALIENRPEQFKEMLRDEPSGVKDLSAVRVRLFQALDHYAATKIRWALMESLSIEPTEDETPKPSDRFIFFGGIRAVEKIFEDLLAKLEQK